MIRWFSLASAKVVAAIPWWAAGLLSNACIMYVEYTNRSMGGATWLRVLPYTVVPIIVAQWALFHAWGRGPSLMVTWATFSVGNSIMRLIVSHYMVGEVFDWRTPLGVAVMFGGALLVKAGMK